MHSHIVLINSNQLFIEFCRTSKEIINFIQIKVFKRNFDLGKQRALSVKILLSIVYIVQCALSTNYAYAVCNNHKKN